MNPHLAAGVAKVGIIQGDLGVRTICWINANLLTSISWGLDHLLSNPINVDYIFENAIIIKVS